MSSSLFTSRFLELAGEDFRTRGLGRDFVRVKAGKDHTNELLTWASLNHILTTHHLPAPRLRLFREGTQVPVNRYTRDDAAAGRPALIPDALYWELREGASLVLDSIDRLHPPITSASDDLMRLVRELVQVNLYLVWGDLQGFDTHWDDHDTMIVQLEGSKHWTIYGQGRRYPMKVDNDRDHRPPETPVWEGVLEPGDIIHVPRGWWHAVRGTGEMSMHLTFGFTRRTGIDWANWVVEQLYSEELFRQDLPRFDDDRLAGAHAEELTEALAKIVAAHPPVDFLATRDRRFPRRPEVNLPWAVRFEMPGDDVVVELTALLELDVRESEGAVSATVSGKTFRFAPVMAPLLRVLAAERAVPVGRLRSESQLSEDVFAGALELVVNQHLAVIRA